MTAVMCVNWFFVNLFYFFDFCINRLIVLVFVVLLVLAFGLKREFLKLTLPFIKLGPSHSYLFIPVVLFYSQVSSHLYLKTVEFNTFVAIELGYNMQSHDKPIILQSHKRTSKC